MFPGIDDHQLTAYALGELSGAERAEVAAFLVGSDLARRYVAGIRATASVLSDQLARESFGGLTELQHAVIERNIEERGQPANRRIYPGKRRDRFVLAMSLAASVLIVGGVVAALVPFIYRRVEVATQQISPNAAPKLIPIKVPVNPVPGTGLPSYVADKNDSRRGNPLVTVDPNEMGFEDKFPLPDDGLVRRGSGREETSLSETPLIGVPHDNHGVPVASPQLTRNTPGSKGMGLPSQGNGASNIVAIPANKKPDTFLELPHNRQAPEKEHLTSPGSPGAMTTSTSPGEAYSHLLENPFVDAAKEPISGFVAGVDTASYSNVRRFLTHGKLPPQDAVRIEEMLNYFPTPLSGSTGDGPLSLQVETGACPWKPEHRLARICVQARPLPPIARPPVNLVWVVDVSDSMRSEKAKLPLLKGAMRMLVGKLSARDRVAIVSYSSREASVVLPSTSAEDKQSIWAALERLETAGTGNSGQGIEVAYGLASRGFIRSGVNRVILASDGNWTVGATDRSHLMSIVRDKSREGISLTVLGVGMNNLKDATLQKLAASGNGSYAYIDTLDEAKKVLVDQVNGALIAAARDVKVQVAFNPSAAQSYRLIGYERRALSREQIQSQSKPGGELGAGQSVTALFEIEVTATNKSSLPRPVDLLTATVTYSDVAATISRHSLQTVGEDRNTPVPRTSTEFRFAAAVAEFGLLLHDSNYKGNATYSGALDLAQEAAGPDDTGYRQELLHLIRKAKSLSPNQ